jgi:succinate dehydrogenase/fumarate reductase flavoprotein subunit
MASWERSVDFLAVGSGAAGMTAALRAHHLGGETLVVEKSPVFGGSTALSGGVVWVPNNPPDGSSGNQRFRQGSTALRINGMSGAPLRPMNREL